MNITEAFKIDLAHKGDFAATPGGDLYTISGLDNLKAALFHRLMTVPGTLVHRPLYGVGAPMFQNSLSSFTKQQELASIIHDQFKQDPRVEDVTSVSVSSNDSSPQQTVIKVFVKPVGYSEQEMKFTPFV
jgi:phage baseplate assembly protein W